MTISVKPSMSAFFRFEENLPGSTTPHEKQLNASRVCDKQDRCLRMGSQNQISIKSSFNCFRYDQAPFFFAFPNLRGRRRRIRRNFCKFFIVVTKTSNLIASFGISPCSAHAIDRFVIFPTLDSNQLEASCTANLAVT